MINGLFYALLFLTSAILQVSLVQVFQNPIAVLPLHFLIGVIVLQRAGNEIGLLWFLFSSAILNLIGFSDAPWYAYLLAGVSGIILTKKIFTSHSVYGLEGLGISMYLIFSLANGFSRLSTSMNDLGNDVLYGLIGLIIGLYFTFLIANYINYISKNLLITRKNQRSL